MHYIFLTRENNKVTLEPTSISYLNVIFSQNINKIVDSGISPFFYELTTNLTTLKPILKNLQNIPNGNKILIPIFHAVSVMSYHLPESLSKVSYNVLLDVIPNIQKDFEDSLVYRNSHPEPCIEINPSLLNFLNICHADTSKMINNRYQQEYEKLLQTPVDVSAIIPIFHAHHKEKPFVNLAISLSASIEMGYKENIALDLSQIDINEPALKNFIYLKFLEVKLKNNEPVKASLELCDYIRNIHQKEKQSLIPSVGSFLDLEMMASKVLHSRFDSDLKEKAANVRKPKI